MNIVSKNLNTSNLIRLIEVFLGIVFFISAYSKLIEINKFTVQIYSYGVIDNKLWLPWIALTVILVELSIAVLLTFGTNYKKLLYFFVLSLLISFSGLILYGWMFHNLKDCGCFGKIEMGPGTSLIKNLLLISLIILCFTGIKKIEIPKSNSFLSTLKVLLLLIVIISAFITGYLKLRTEATPIRSTQTPSSFDPLVNMKFEVDGKLYDFGKGEYLVALLSFSCDHCIEEAPKLNDYSLFDKLPPLVAICLEETLGEKEDFISKVNPEFPIYSLGNKPLLFLSLIDKEPPRLIHIRNGKVLKIWDYNLPNIGEIINYFDSLEPTNSI